MIAYKEYQAIDAQVKEWLERNEKTAKALPKKQIPPVITISREWGSLGNKIAYLLRDRLGDPWRVWDKQIIGEIAKRAEVRNEVVKSIEKKGLSHFEAFFKNFFGVEVFEKSEYRKHVTSILLALGHRGYAIIIGRGGNFILPRAFRVRIVASRKYRMEHLKKEGKISEEEALYVMRQADHESSEFVKQVFDGDINAPWNYDLCLKTNYIKPETAVEMISSGAKDKLGKLTV